MKALGLWQKAVEARRGRYRGFSPSGMQQLFKRKCLSTVKTLTSVFCTSAVKDAYYDLIVAFLFVSRISGFETVTKIPKAAVLQMAGLRALALFTIYCEKCGEITDQDQPCQEGLRGAGR